MDNTNPKNNFKTITIDNIKYRTRLTKKFLSRKTYKPRDPKKVFSFIPGSIKKINIKAGSKVNIQDKLIIFEAMKMDNYILSPIEGVIKKIYVKTGEQVPKEYLLLEFQ
ncbi:MAG: acetyl-CoA carboxylase biotin carboxyl carrier protein subunit [Bacteroidales bacterium]|nr:acetyl-CoA carboxylase biotin carboxyl carrier protein subunit [Bacteroidales bacterium]